MQPSGVECLLVKQPCYDERAPMLLFGHATSLVYPGHGSIKASLNLGMDVEDLLSAGLAWRFALRAALEAKLTF